MVAHAAGQQTSSYSTPERASSVHHSRAGSESAAGQAPVPAVKTRVHLSSNAIAGVAAGFSSSVLTHPLDVVKTRFQVQLRVAT
jgi:hypothetical protein